MLRENNLNVTFVLKDFQPNMKFLGIRRMFMKKSDYILVKNVSKVLNVRETLQNMRNVYMHRNSLKKCVKFV